MTDYSKIKSIDELDSHVERLQRKEAAQRGKLKGHADYVARQYRFVVNTCKSILNPVRDSVNEYVQAGKLIYKLYMIFFGSKA